MSNNNFEHKSKEDRPVVAICYDFDKTLSPNDMQAQGYIQSVGYDIGEFWKESNSLAENNDMDQNLAYMYKMVKESEGHFVFNRKTLDNQESMNISKEIDEILLNNNAKKNSGVMTVTHNISVENGKQINVEMFIPLDKEITTPSGYRFLPSFVLNDAYKLRIEGSPQQMQEAIQKFAEYINSKNLKPSTPLYVVTVKESTGPLNVDNMITDLYSGVESI